MISSTGVKGKKSDEYKPEVLCPEIFNPNGSIKEDWRPGGSEGDNSVKHKNIMAIQEYTTKLSKKFAENLQQKHDNKPKTHNTPKLLQAVRENLEKVAAKNFIPSFVSSETVVFKKLIAHAKKTTEKYSNISRDNEDTEKYITEHVPLRNQEKQTKKKDQDKYAERLRYRIRAYKAWEFYECKENENKFILKNDVGQEITVTKEDNGKFIVQYTSDTAPITDETIGIMIELSHSYVRFSQAVKKTEMKLKVKDIKEGDTELADRFSEGFGIINNYRNKPKEEQLDYKIEYKK
jgi:hypothetical protein